MGETQSVWGKRVLKVGQSSLAPFHLNQKHRFATGGREDAGLRWRAKRRSDFSERLVALAEERSPLGHRPLCPHCRTSSGIDFTLSGEE